MYSYATVSYLYAHVTVTCISTTFWFYKFIFPVSFKIVLFASCIAKKAEIRQGCTCSVYINVWIAVRSNQYTPIVRVVTTQLLIRCRQAIEHSVRMLRNKIARRLSMHKTTCMNFVDATLSWYLCRCRSYLNLTRLYVRWNKVGSNVSAL